MLLFFPLSLLLIYFSYILCKSIISMKVILFIFPLSLLLISLSLSLSLFLSLSLSLLAAAAATFAPMRFSSLYKSTSERNSWFLRGGDRGITFTDEIWPSNLFFWCTEYTCGKEGGLKEAGRSQTYIVWYESWLTVNLMHEIVTVSLSLSQISLIQSWAEVWFTGLQRNRVLLG